jgi:hypothetical protein
MLVLLLEYVLISVLALRTLCYCQIWFNCPYREPEFRTKRSLNCATITCTDALIHDKIDNHSLQIMFHYMQQ